MNKDCSFDWESKVPSVLDEYTNAVSSNYINDAMASDVLEIDLQKYVFLSTLDGCF